MVRTHPFHDQSRGFDRVFPALETKPSVASSPRRVSTPVQREPYGTTLGVEFVGA